MSLETNFRMVDGTNGSLYGILRTNSTEKESEEGLRKMRGICALFETDLTELHVYEQALFYCGNLLELKGNYPIARDVDFSLFFIWGTSTKMGDKKRYLLVPFKELDLGNSEKARERIQQARRQISRARDSLPDHLLRSSISTYSNKQHMGFRPYPEEFMADAKAQGVSYVKWLSQSRKGCQSLNILDLPSLELSTEPLDLLPAWAMKLVRRCG